MRQVAGRLGYVLLCPTVAACLQACGGSSPTSPTPLDSFARSASAIYMINGLSSRVVDLRAARLEAAVHVGETAKLGLNLQGEGYHNRERWTSTNSAS